MRIVNTLSSVNQYSVQLLAWDRSNASGPIDDGKNKHYQSFVVHHKSPYGILFIFYLIPWFFLSCCRLIGSKANVVHACDFDALIPAILVKKFFGKRYMVIYDIFDLYSHRIPSPIGKIVGKIEILFTNLSDAVIICDELRKAEIKNARLKRLEVIVNSPQEYIPDYVVSNKNELDNGKKDSDFTIFYAGLLTFNSGLVDICKALDGLQGIRFLIAGYGEKEHWFREFFRQYPNVVFLGRLSHEEVIKMTLNSAVVVIMRKPLSVSRFSNPNKFFEALMCGVPVIVTKGTGIDRLVELQKCGLVVNYGDISSLRAAIIQLKDNAEMRKTLGNNGRAIYVNQYRWEIMRTRLLRLYDSIDRD